MRQLLFVLISVLAALQGRSADVLPYPILFVTQTPNPSDFTTIGSLFGNHRGTMDSAPRGGALYIRYEDGTVRNLTAASGYGLSGSQNTNGIAVREPSVSWDGKKAIFSMVIGAPKKQYDYQTYYWQLYEITNIASNQTPVITKVANQPTNYNNISPVYGTDDRIIFTTDRPRDGQRHLYPQIDEYEEAPVVTGLWSLDPATGDLFIMNHSPSGAFSPSVDSFGRVIFSRWDHLQRDQQADTDNEEGTSSYGTFNYSSEAANAQVLFNTRTEIFPELREKAAGSITNGHTFNHFFPWQIHENGEEEETLNHIGRHELGGSYRNAAITGDPNIQDLYYFGNKPNTNTINNFLQLRESATVPGLIYGIDAPEFSTHSAGQIIALDGAPSINPDLMKLTYVTHRDTSSYTDNPAATHTGLYRNPLPLSDGRLAAIHTAETRNDRNDGTTAAPKSRYDFRLKLLKKVNGYFQPDTFLTPGIQANISWWQPDYPVTFAGTMWELDPIEVRPRTRPTKLVATLPAPEEQIFREEGVDPAAFKNYLRQRDLALIVSRDVTGRDKGDQLQPFNLRVPGGKETVGKAGKVYDIQYMQMFQADMIRGIGMRQANSTPSPGRRALAQEMHDPLTDNPPITNPSAPISSVKIANDGSVAALVPARRAMTWQTTSPTGEPVVRERYWVTFQRGEIRTCANCHGVNRSNQANEPASVNPPEALRALLKHWKTNNTTVVSTTTVAGQPVPTVTFKRQMAATAVKQRVEFSTDLSAWFPASEYTAAGGVHVGPLLEVQRSGGPFDAITLRDAPPAPGEPKRFYRVLNEKP
jgi:hypothetical protein